VAVDLVEEIVALDGIEVRLERPRDTESLLDEHAFEADEYLPYWAEMWPSSIALARAVAVRGLGARRVLELGCGLGLPSIVAALRGARVLATDWSADAVAATARNAALNDAPLETARVAFDAAQALVERAPWDLVLASDVLYETRMAEALLALLPRLVDARGAVWLADPGRPAADYFFDCLDDRWQVTTTPDAAAPRVSVHRLRLVA